MTESEIADMRAYLRQWIEADCWSSPVLADLRLAISRLVTREAIDEWLDDALDEGIDPL